MPLSLGSTTLALALGFAISGATIARAQSAVAPSGGAPASELRMSASRLWNGSADESISPLHYIGSGISIDAGYRRRNGRTLLDARLVGGHSSTAGEAAPGESAQHGDVSVAALRTLGRSDDGVSIGVQLRARASLTEHRYDDPRAIDSHFLLGALTVGPRAEWRQRVGTGSLEASLGTDLLSFVDRPYGSVGTGRPPLRLRFAPPTSFHTASAALSYIAATRARIGLMATYRFDALDYRDTEPVRTVSQSLGVGALVRLGGAR